MAITPPPDERGNHKKDPMEAMAVLQRRLAEGLGPAKFAQEFAKLQTQLGRMPISPMHGGDRCALAPCAQLLPALACAGEVRAHGVCCSRPMRPPVVRTERRLRCRAIRARARAEREQIAPQVEELPSPRRREGLVRRAHHQHVGQARAPCLRALSATLRAPSTGSGNPASVKLTTPRPRWQTYPTSAALDKHVLQQALIDGDSRLH
jgi:hypothetical protein